MVVFDKLCRTARSLRVYKTESVSVMCHKWSAACSVFHRVGPETTKLLWPYLVVLWCDTVVEQRCL